MKPFKPPKDPALHAIWVIRNWTQRPIGNMQSPEDVLRKVNRLANEVFEAATKENNKEAS